MAVGMSDCFPVQLDKDGDKTVPLFTLLVHLPGAGCQNLQSSPEGWVVNRRLQDFYNVHEKLVQVRLFSWVMDHDTVLA